MAPAPEMGPFDDPVMYFAAEMDELLAARPYSTSAGTISQRCSVTIWLPTTETRMRTRCSRSRCPKRR
jgi:hypothetical protein